MTRSLSVIGSFGEIVDWPPNPARRLLLVGCLTGCLVGLTGCSGVSAAPAHRARHRPAKRHEPRASRAGSAGQPCAPTDCRRFAVSGDTSIQDTTSDPSSDQAETEPGGPRCADAQRRRAVEEANDVAEGAALLGAPDGADLMRHFLSGRGTPLTFGPASSVAGLISGDAAFQRTTRSVQAELKQQLLPLTARHRGTAPIQITLDRTFLLGVRPDFDNLSRDPDLYLSFRGTQGLSVRGTGRAYLPSRRDHEGHVTGSLTYTISDVYGFSSETQFRILGHAVGPDLHYLQTTCGAPAHIGGAHWFRDAASVITPFRFPIS